MLAVRGGLPLSLADVAAAFSNKDGLMVRAAECALCPEDLMVTKPGSASVWRDDLPLALWVMPGLSPPDAAGVVYVPSTRNTACAFAVDANSNRRCRDAAGSVALRPCPANTVYEHCGKSYDSIVVLTNHTEMSGACFSEDAAIYVDTYFNRPQFHYSMLDIESFWMLEDAQCHFTSVPRMLDAQRELLRRAATLPPNTTAAQWLANATKLGYGLTAFNEVVVQPPSTVGGLLWSHDGPFRLPAEKDPAACTIAAHLRANANASVQPLPIFEAAFVNLERPFKGCYPDGPQAPPSPDCVSRGLSEWHANVSAGHRARSSFRIVEPSNFLQLECKR